jgi:hypothetical protein
VCVCEIKIVKDYCLIIKMGGCLSRNEETVSIDARPPSGNILENLRWKQEERPIINLSHDSTIYYRTYRILSLASPLISLSPYVLSGFFHNIFLRDK